MSTLATLMVKNPPANAGDPDTWVTKIPWSRKWQPTPVIMPGKAHGQRSLVGYSPWCRKDSDTTEHTHTHTHTPTLKSGIISIFVLLTDPSPRGEEKGDGVGVGVGFWIQDLELRAGGQHRAWPRVPARGGERRRLCLQTRLLSGWVGPPGTAALTPKVSFMPLTTNQRQGWDGPGG